MPKLSDLLREGLDLLARNRARMKVNWIDRAEKKRFFLNALEAASAPNSEPNNHLEADEFITHGYIENCQDAETRWRNEFIIPWREAAKSVSDRNVQRALELIETMPSRAIRRGLKRLVLLAQESATRTRRRAKKGNPKHWHPKARSYLKQTQGEISDAEIARLCGITQSVVSRDVVFQALRRSYVVKTPVKQLHRNF